MRPTIHPGLPRAPRGAAFAALLLALVGCGTTSSSSQGAWEQPRTHQGPYAVVLVVAVTQDSRVRRTYEQQLAATITSDGAKGVAAFKVGQETGNEATTRDNILALARVAGADAILITRVTNAGAKQGETEEQAQVELAPSMEVYQSSDMTAVISTPYTIKQEPGSPIIVANAALETLVYEPARDDRLVYRATTQASFDIGADESIEDDAADLANAVAKQLRGDGVIR